MKRLLILISLATLTALFVACGGDDGETTPTPGVTTPANTGPTPVPTEFPDSGPTTLRLGYFANVTHAVPLVGLNNGIFEEELGSNVTVEDKTFNAGPDVITALFAGEIDASYIGPNPAVNGYIQSDGNDVRIVSGAASGGALLIVQQDINSPSDLAGKKLATPQLGNTQDVALRAWLQTVGLKDNLNGGNVQVIPQTNADSLTSFSEGRIDGAWVPEPWATRLIQEGGGKVLIDEKELWPDGKFATTLLILRTGFLNDHPDVVQKLVSASVKTVQWIDDNPDEAKQLTNDQIAEITSKGLAAEVIDAAWENIEFTFDPVAESVRTSADHAYELGLLQDEPVLTNLFDLSILNRVLIKKGLAGVTQ